MAAISSDIIIYPSFNDVNTSSGGGRINKALAKATNTPVVILCRIRHRP